MSNKNISIPDDCDIILETPEKPKKKKLKKTCSKSKGSKSGMVTSEKTSPESSLNSVTNNPKLNKSLKTNKRRLMSYIYHNHQEFLSYKMSQLPKHNNMKLVGLLKQKFNIYILLQCGNRLCCDPIRLSALVCFENASVLPDLGEYLEVYGFLDFKAFGVKYLPILQVNFWKRINEDEIADYIILLEKQKQYVPRNYREIVPVLDATVYLEVASDMTVLFDDCNESVFKNITLLENNADAFQEMLDISFDIFF